MNPNNLNLYIVDDDANIRRSVGSLLLARLEDCSIKAFESGEAFLEGANLDGSGIVILDLRMDPGMSGLDVHTALNLRKSPLVVVFLSAHGDIPVAVRAMQEGAFGWLEKPCPDAELIAMVLAAKERAKVIAGTRRDQYAARQKWNPLTLREKQVASLTAKGHSSKEAAQLLERQHPDCPINHRTVENHRAKVFAKLEVNNSNELLLVLQNNGLLNDAQASLLQHPGRTTDAD